MNSEQNMLVSGMHLSQPIAAWLGIAIILAASRLLTAERPPDKSLLIAATITVLGVVVEACSWNGLDNVAVPLSAFLILRLL